MERSTMPSHHTFTSNIQAGPVSDGPTAEVQKGSQTITFDTDDEAMYVRLKSARRICNRLSRTVTQISRRALTSALNKTTGHYIHNCASVPDRTRHITRLVKDIKELYTCACAAGLWDSDCLTGLTACASNAALVGLISTSTGSSTSPWRDGLDATPSITADIHWRDTFRYSLLPQLVTAISLWNQSTVRLRKESSERTQRARRKRLGRALGDSGTSPLRHSEPAGPILPLEDTEPAIHWALDHMTLEPDYLTPPHATERPVRDSSRSSNIISNPHFSRTEHYQTDVHPEPHCDRHAPGEASASAAQRNNLRLCYDAVIIADPQGGPERALRCQPAKFFPLPGTQALLPEDGSAIGSLGM